MAPVIIWESARPKNSLFAPSLLQGMEKSSIFSNLKKGKFLLIFPHVHFAIHHWFENDGGTRIAGAQILRLVSYWSLAMIMQGKCFPAVWCVSISVGNPAMFDWMLSELVMVMVAAWLVPQMLSRDRHRLSSSLHTALSTSAMSTSANFCSALLIKWSSVQWERVLC